MSAIASFYVIHTDLLVHEPGTVDELAEAYGRRIDPDEFGYSGWLMMDVVFYLADRDIPITDTEIKFSIGNDGPLTFVLSNEHRPLLPQLDPAEYTLADIRDGLEDYDELDDDEVAVAFSDTLNMLRNKISDLADDEALVILIG